jgi:rfaE bifunctional protein nucleotidyltransferase chain/domain
MHVSLVSEHASPLAALGGVDAGGQNVHVAQTATLLASRGHNVDVYTRRTDPAQPETTMLRPGLRVIHVDAGPPTHVPKEELMPYMAEFSDARSRFDIFHAGHAEFLASAAEQGDALLVAINTDASVSRLKGEGRPVNELEERLRVLEAIGVVSAVTWFGGDTAAEVAESIAPDVYVKGSDYRGASFPEAELVAARGGRVFFVDLLQGRSTSEIVRRTRNGKEVAV